MYFLVRNSVVSIVIFWLYLLDHCSLLLNRRVVLISLERPKITEVNPYYARVFNITTRRPGRSDPVHYMHLWLEYFQDLDNISEITINIYEFLSNDYRPTFVAVKLNFCELFLQFVKLEKLYYTSNLSIPITHWDLRNKCFLKAGIYYYANLSVPLTSFPKNFPFEKGRLLITQTYKSQLVVAGTLDMELKTLPMMKHKGRS